MDEEVKKLIPEEKWDSYLFVLIFINFDLSLLFHGEI